VQKSKSKSTAKKPDRKLSEWRSRTRHLLVLPDQGAPLTVSPEDLGIKGGRDSSWNAYADSFQRANDVFLKALDIQVLFSSRPNEIAISLKANGVIGAIPLRAPDTHKIAGGIVVRPRFGWSSVGALFSLIGWSAAPEILNCPLVPGSAQEIPAWVIAGPVVAELERLLRFAGPKFRERNETRSSPRGKIEWPKYCSEQLARGNFQMLPCTFSDLDVDHQLRGFIKWALNRISNQLAPFSSSDLFARNLWDRVNTLLITLRSSQLQIPNHRALDSMQQSLHHRSIRTDLGIEALRWVLDERGLAGSTDMDGLSWRIKMHDLFEQWVEKLVSVWAAGFGGRVVSGRNFGSLSAITWERRSVDSLSSLIPDVVVHDQNHTYVFDAKYKGFLGETPELSWHNSSTLIREDHRHDLHQIMAYSSLYGLEEVTVALVYPLQLEEWRRLSERQAAVTKGFVGGPNRRINLALIGVPIDLRGETDPTSVTQDWNRLREI
jgi:hypothetical protein